MVGNANGVFRIVGQDDAVASVVEHSGGRHKDILFGETPGLFCIFGGLSESHEEELVTGGNVKECLAVRRVVRLDGCVLDRTRLDVSTLCATRSDRK